MKFLRGSPHLKFSLFSNFLMLLILIGSENEWKDLSDYLIENLKTHLPVIHLLIAIELINFLILLITYKKFYKEIILKFYGLDYRNKYKKKINQILNHYSLINLIFNLSIFIVFFLKAKKIFIISAKFLFFHSPFLVLILSSVIVLYGIYSHCRKRKKSRSTEYFFRNQQNLNFG